MPQPIMLPFIFPPYKKRWHIISSYNDSDFIWRQGHIAEKEIDSEKRAVFFSRCELCEDHLG